jgi:hypothetical protein
VSAERYVLCKNWQGNTSLHSAAKWSKVAMPQKPSLKEEELLHWFLRPVAHLENSLPAHSSSVKKETGL